jgi:hypothetical protein
MERTSYIHQQMDGAGRMAHEDPMPRAAVSFMEMTTAVLGRALTELAWPFAGPELEDIHASACHTQGDMCGRGLKPGRFIQSLQAITADVASMERYDAPGKIRALGRARPWCSGF